MPSGDSAPISDTAMGRSCTSCMNHMAKNLIVMPAGIRADRGHGEGGGQGFSAGQQDNVSPAQQLWQRARRRLRCVLRRRRAVALTVSRAAHTQGQRSDSIPAPTHPRPAPQTSLRR